MTLVNASLLAVGSLFVAVPIVLHLIMRQQPKQLVFPALRFLQQRRLANRRKLQLRHWLLLLLRCGAICLLAAALARPSVASASFGNWLVIAGLFVVLLLLILVAALAVLQRRGLAWIAGLGTLSTLLAAVIAVLTAGVLRDGANVLLGDEEAPVAAVLVFDTSPRMQYRTENQTRLQQARKMATWMIRQLPNDSEVAVSDLRLAASVFAVDLGAAAKAIEGLETTAVPMSLDRMISAAVDLVRTTDKARKELYLFTDLTEAGWQISNRQALAATLADAADVPVYVLDVGVEDPRNVALGELKLSAQSLPRNSDLRIQTELQRSGPAEQRTVELYLEEQDDERPVIIDGQALLPASNRHGRETVQLEQNGSRWLEFSLGGLDVGTHHGWVRVVGEDGLPLDDVRYFTVEVTSAWSVLVAVGPDAYAPFLTDALAPYEFRQTGRARFGCETIDTGQLPTRELADYDAVCLLDPAPLAPDTWQKLEAFARGGGGVAIFLGGNAKPVNSFNQPAAQQLLPGKLVRQWRAAGGGLYLAPRNFAHPILAAFRPIRTSVPWDNLPVFRHWVLGELAVGAAPVLAMGNGKPALIEQRVGNGRVLTMTTPVSDVANRTGRLAWNRLPTGPEPWPFVMLTNEMLMYLVQSGDRKLNYLTGQTATLSRPPSTGPERYQLFTARGDWQEVSAERDFIAVRFTDAPGIYRLKPNNGSQSPRGFSVNLPPAASRLDRLPPDALDEILGPGRYQLARSREEIDRGIGQQRMGREFYPLLMVMLAIVLGLEHTLANRFYASRKPGKENDE